MYQVWKITHGSLTEDAKQIHMTYVDKFTSIKLARQFIQSADFIATLNKETNTEVFIIPEKQILFLCPAMKKPKTLMQIEQACLSLAETAQQATPPHPSPSATNSAPSH